MSCICVTQSIKVILADWPLEFKIWGVYQGGSSKSYVSHNTYKFHMTVILLHVNVLGEVLIPYKNDLL